MRKGDIRKQEILDMAETLFCRNGYEQTGIQEILDRLKISKGSFYHHYVSKEALLDGICRRRAEQIFSAASAAVDPEGSAVLSLDILLTGMIPFRDEKLSFLLMLLPIFRLPEGRMVREGYCDALSGQFLDAVSEQLKRGQETGEMACDDPDTAAGLILSLVNRLWVLICGLIIRAEEEGRETDLSECLRLTDCYRTAAERILSLPYGSLELIDIPVLGHLSEQIHSHWVR